MLLLRLDGDTVTICYYCGRKIEVVRSEDNYHGFDMWVVSGTWGADDDVCPDNPDGVHEPE